MNIFCLKSTTAGKSNFILCVLYYFSMEKIIANLYYGFLLLSEKLNRLFASVFLFIIII